MSFDADVLACAAIVEKGDPERFAAAMASPLAARKVLFPLYAFNVEVTRAPWVTQEPMIAEMRLQWWRDALEEIANGVPVRRHEVVTPLSTFLTAESAARLDRLVTARRWDIYKDPFEDETHFETYLTETTASLMLAGLEALGQDMSDQTVRTVENLGYCTGLSRFLQAVPTLEDHGRIPLLDGRREAIGALARDAGSRCPTRGALRSVIDGAARPAVTEAFLAPAVLGEVAKRPQSVADGTIEIAPLKRSILLWRWS
ncbi:MAG: squalene/phytoene synthase family protein [Roseobacter sp.]